MHIMQLCSGGGAMNGAMVHCQQLTAELVRRGHRVTLVCRPGTAMLEFLRYVDVHIVESDQYRWPADELRRIARLIAETDVEVMHAHMSRAQFFAVLLRTLTGVPSVATAHCRNIKLHRRFNDFVIANSEANFRTQQRWNLVSRRRMATVHYPGSFADLTHFDDTARTRLRRELGAGPDDPLLGIVGNICRRKGQDLLIRALPRILQRWPSARVAFFGNAFAETAEFQQLANELGVAEHICWPGFRQDIGPVMASLDVLLCPSREEAFGLTAAESLACGTPVIAARVGGLPETVVHEETGLLVPPGKVAPLAAAIERMLSDEVLSQRCRTQGPVRMREKYDAARIWDRIEQILLDIGAGRSPRDKPQAHGSRKAA